MGTQALAYHESVLSEQSQFARVQPSIEVAVAGLTLRFPAIDLGQVRVE